MKVAIVGDPFFPASVLADEIRRVGGRDELTTLDLGSGVDPAAGSEGISEYFGSPADVTAALHDHEALVVHAAPVTARVLDASSRLALVCCARGGPVNVDVEAASARGIPVVTAPGKNANAVVELTLAFLIMLARRMHVAMDELARNGRMGDSVLEGAEFMGRELSGHTLGLIGYGNVGRLVGARARSCGMDVRAFDPYVDRGVMEADGTRPVDLDTLLAESEFISLHARATAENENMIGAAQLARMRPSACLVNTARETLIDEAALRGALERGQLAGAAVDVVRATPDGAPHPLLALHNVIATPHIGGATVETLRRGAEMVVAELHRFRTGAPLRNVANREALARAAAGDGRSRPIRVAARQGDGVT